MPLFPELNNDLVSSLGSWFRILFLFEIVVSFPTLVSQAIHVGAQRAPHRGHGNFAQVPPSRLATFWASIGSSECWLLVVTQTIVNTRRPTQVGPRVILLMGRIGVCCSNTRRLRLTEPIIEYVHPLTWDPKLTVRVGVRHPGNPFRVTRSNRAVGTLPRKATVVRTIHITVSLVESIDYDRKRIIRVKY